MAAHRSVQVDPRLCEAHALCIELAPEVFDLGGDIAKVEKIPSDVANIDVAISACPRQAISWAND